VQVRAGRAARRTHVADELTAADLVADRDALDRQVCVAGGEAAAVVDLDPAAVARRALVGHAGDASRRGRGDRVAIVVGAVEVDRVGRAVIGSGLSVPDLVAGKGHLVRGRGAGLWRDAEHHYCGRGKGRAGQQGGRTESAHLLPPGRSEGRDDPTTSRR